MLSKGPSKTTKIAAQERLAILVNVLRDYLMDWEESNHLIESREFTDNQLRSFLLMALDFPSLTLWLDTASMFALKSIIYRFNRNAFQYNDSGTSVSVEEKGPMYEATMQRIMQEVITACKSVKENINLENCYGGFSSEFLNMYVPGNLGSLNEGRQQQFNRKATKS
jgi:hypothetical protein